MRSNSVFQLMDKHWLGPKIEERVILLENGAWKWAKEDKISEKEHDYSCSTLIFEKYDKMNGLAIFGTKEPLKISDDDGKTGFEVGVRKSKYYYELLITAKGAGEYIKVYAKSKILFRDGSIIELSHFGENNCKPEFTATFEYNTERKNLTLLMSQEVETIKVGTTDGFVQKDFTEEQSRKLFETFKCLQNVTSPQN